MSEKLTEEVTVKLSATGKRFISVRAKQMGFESSADYRLLADALGHNVTTGNKEN